MVIIYQSVHAALPRLLVHWSIETVRHSCCWAGTGFHRHRQPVTLAREAPHELASASVWATLHQQNVISVRVAPRQQVMRVAPHRPAGGIEGWYHAGRLWRQCGWHHRGKCIPTPACSGWTPPCPHRYEVSPMAGSLRER